MNWYTSDTPPTGPHFHGLVIDEDTGATIAVVYDDEDRSKSRLIAAAPRVRDAAQAVIDAWGSGDLAAAVRGLSRALSND